MPRHSSMTFVRAAILWVAGLGFAAVGVGASREPSEPSGSDTPFAVLSVQATPAVRAESRGGRFEVEGSVASPESLGPSRSPDSTLELWGGLRPIVAEEALFADGFETGDLSSWTSDSGAIR